MKPNIREFIYGTHCPAFLLFLTTLLVNLRFLNRRNAEIFLHINDDFLGLKKDSKRAVEQISASWNLLESTELRRRNTQFNGCGGPFA